MIGKRLTVLVAAAGLAAAACSSSPGSQPVRGQVLGGSQAAATTFTALGGVSGICGGAVAGTQVIIKGPDGKLLATTNLSFDRKASAKLAGLIAQFPTAQLGIYSFATSVPAGPGPYTVDLVGITSLVVSASQLPHLSLTCSGG